MAGYVSEFTQFITELKAAKPQLEAEQRKGRAIWWDKQPLDGRKSRIRIRPTRALVSPQRQGISLAHSPPG